MSTDLLTLYKQGLYYSYSLYSHDNFKVI